MPVEVPHLCRELNVALGVVQDCLGLCVGLTLHEVGVNVLVEQKLDRPVDDPATDVEVADRGDNVAGHGLPLVSHILDGGTVNCRSEGPVLDDVPVTSVVLCVHDGLVDIPQ